MVARSGNTSRRSEEGRERRRFGRFTTRLPVMTVRDDLAARGQQRRAARCRLELQDFSLGGLRAASAVRLKVNERLTLRIPPHLQQPPLELTGRVIHCERNDDRYQVGIEFCHTLGRQEGAPWRHLPRLFSLAGTAADTPRALNPL